MLLVCVDSKGLRGFAEYIEIHNNVHISDAKGLITLCIMNLLALGSSFTAIFNEVQ